MHTTWIVSILGGRGVCIHVTGQRYAGCFELGRVYILLFVSGSHRSIIMQLKRYVLEVLMISGKKKTILWKLRMFAACTSY